MLSGRRPTTNKEIKSDLATFGNNFVGMPVEHSHTWWNPLAWGLPVRRPMLRNLFGSKKITLLVKITVINLRSSYICRLIFDLHTFVVQGIERAAWDLRVASNYWSSAHSTIITLVLVSFYPQNDTSNSMSALSRAFHWLDWDWVLTNGNKASAGKVDGLRMPRWGVTVVSS